MLFDLVREERFARDHEQWERLKACYTADSRVRVTWFTGTGAAFADASVAQVRGPSTGRHLMFPMDARIEKDRAVVESDAMIQVRMTKDEVEFDLETCCRFLSWARRTAEGWRLVTFDCIYLKDTLRTLDPEVQLPIDWQDIAKRRPSYRFLDWLLGASGYPIDQNLAGIDRPETVAALYAEAEDWLEGRVDTPALPA
ncbi:nuclear transport factor 2 family protein [Novosphingobium sp.]|uniref:nuclear transport factor 2 family protein n=1 Tax=Novosphingobium sp. TaxID=1874826 RepID=UPI002625F331|nr:nuclear transport factor 2 family protein [Novosphingobium sp.]